MTARLSGFCRAAALGAAFALLPFTRTHDPGPDRGAEAAARPLIVTWGDSIASGIGISLQRQGATVVNLGVNGAGIRTGVQVLPLGRLPRGALVLMSVGTNDVPFAMNDNASPGDIEKYARQVAGLALDVRRQGATPVVIGMQAPFGPYTGGTPNWYAPGFTEEWADAMTKINAAVEKECAANGIAWSPVQGRVPERADDRLHYTEEGYLHIVRNALADTGLPGPEKFASNPPHKGKRGSRL